VTEITRERCITCSDEAVEAEVVAVHGFEATVLVAGVHEHVAIDLVPNAAAGDLLLCHAGIALERLEGSRESPHIGQSDNVQPTPGGGQATR
jgi:hydrogenase maturation factor